MYFLAKQLPELKGKNFKERFWFLTYTSVKSTSFKIAVFVPTIVMFIILLKFGKYLTFTNFNDKGLNHIIPIWIAMLIYAPFLQLFSLNYVAPKFTYDDMLKDEKFKELLKK